MKPNGTHDWSSKSILIAEDEESNFQLIYEILLPTGVKLTRALNGKQAIKIFESGEHFDLILLDIKMPIMDGFETITRLREKDKKIPIFAQTVFGMPEYLLKGQEAGFNEFITKPIILSRFLERIAAYLDD
jgi:two-component system cell cycle response regulator DivK